MSPKFNIIPIVVFILFCKLISVNGMMEKQSDRHIDDQHNESAKHTINRPLFFFHDARKEIDWAVARSDGMISMLQSAVKMEVGPIIASGCFLRHIDIPDVNITRKIPGSSLFLILSKNYILSEIEKAKKITGNELELDIYELDEFYEDKHRYTDLELFLGLRINHMKQNDEYTSNDYKGPEHLPALFYDADRNASNIFCIDSDYSLCEESFPRIQWSILFMGHGTPATDSYLGDKSTLGSICNMPLKVFRSVLDFFQSRVSTRIFTYLSCYAGGINSSFVYGENLFESSKKFSFPIVSISLADLPVTMETTKEQLNKGFIQFTKEITKDGQIDYYELGKNLVSSGQLSIQHLASNVQVRYPETTWFSPVGKNLLSIGKVLAEKRTRPLNVQSFFGKKIDRCGTTILLYANNVQFDLIIDTQYPYRFDKFLSMIPGKATHRLKKVSFFMGNREDWNLQKAMSNVFYYFTHATHVAFEKNFLIDEIEIILINQDTKKEEDRFLAKDVLIQVTPEVGDSNRYSIHYLTTEEQEDKAFTANATYKENSLIIDRTCKEVNSFDFFDGPKLRGYLQKVSSIKEELKTKEIE